MPIYRITAPNGKTYQIEGPPGASDADVAQAVMAQFPEAATPPPETTIGGNIKEGFKGLVPGAINLLESAATGASAILPEGAEQDVRDYVSKTAASAREPFAPAPGYEDSVGRKFGEALGSTAPFFALGPLGVAGRLGMGALGTAAGAGEARTRAEEGGASDNQRGLATVGGAAVGVTEALPVFKFLDSLSTPIKNGIVDYVRRAAVTGGAEGAQEASAQVLQNLIEQQVYNPEQGLLEGSGEAGAYGAGVGAFIQGITDFALGRRTPNVSTPGGPAPIDQARAAAAAKAQATPQSTPAPAGSQIPTGPASPVNPTLEYTPTQEAATEEAPTPQPPQAAEVTPPVTPEAVAPVPGAPASTVMTPELFKELGIKNPNAGVRKALEGKDWSNPEDRSAIIARLGKYLENPNVSSTNAQRVSDFMSSLLDTSTVDTSTVPEPTFRPKGQRVTTPAAPVGTGEIAATPTVSPTPDIAGVGVDSGPISEPPAVQPEPVSVVVPPSIATDTDGREGRTDAAIEAIKEKVRKLKGEPAPKADPLAPVVDVSKLKRAAKTEESTAPKETVEYDEGLAADLVDAKKALAQQIKDYEKSRQALRTKGGALTEDKKAAYDAAGVSIESAKAQIAELNKQLYAQNKAKKNTTSSKVEPLIVAGADKNLPDAGQTEKQAYKEVIEAVGAYNSPISDKLRRDVSVSYLMDAAADKSLNVNSRNFARKALAHGIDRNDVPTPDRARYDELTRGIEDDGTEWGSYVYVKRDVPGKSIPALTKAFEDGNAYAALKAIARDGGPLDKLVAMRLLRMGSFPDIRIVPEGSIQGDGQYDALTDTISITEGQVDTHTVLHELTHAATHKLIVANEQGARNDLGYKRLKELYDRLTGLGLTEDYGFTNVSEFASEAMSNPDFQRLLQRIPYKSKQSVWDWFINSIKNLLGMQSALSEAMTATESLFDVGRGYQETGPALDDRPAVMAGTPAIEQFAQTVDVITNPTKPGAVEQLRKMFGAKNLRQKLTDIDAPIDDLLTKWYGGNIRDASGTLNPMVLLSRLRDALRVSKAAQEYGTIRRHPSGLFKAEELYIPEDSTEFPLLRGQKVSYQGVLSRIAAEAKQQGKTYEAYVEELGGVLYGHREHELMQATANGVLNYTPSLKTAEIAQAEAAYQSSIGLQELAQSLDAIRFSLIDAGVDAGRFSPEKAAAYKSATGYIPFSRVMEFEEQFDKAKGSNRGAAALRNMKPIRGGEQNVKNPIESFSSLMDWFVSESMKNDASIKALKDMALMTVATQVPAPEVISKDSPGKVISVYDGGTRVHYYVPDPALVLTFSYQPPEVSNVLRGLQKGSQILRAGVTAAPPFALKQIADDIIRAYVYSGVKDPLKLTGRILTNFPKLWITEVLGKNNPAARSLEQLGVIGTFDFTESTNLKSILEGAGAKKRGLGANILRVMEAGAKASDLAVRKAIYDQVLQETGDMAAAESRAREIINFSRRGSSRMMDYMIRIVPFFNAHARGMDKLAVAMAGGKVGLSTGQARSMFYKRMSVMTAMGLTYALMMSDDEEYNALSDHVRDRNWVLPYGKELGFTPVIPIPAELAFFFKSIPERVIQYYKLQGTDEERKAMDLIKEGLLQGVDLFSSPNVTPQLLKPILENIANYSFFLGRPLESQSQVANLRPVERFGVGTSELAKSAAQVLENASNKTGVEAIAVSPIKIENLIRGIFGTTAGTALALTDALMNPTRTDRPMHSMLSAQLTGASAFMKDGVGTRYIDELYNLERAAEQVFSTYNRRMEYDPESAVDFLEKNIGLYSIRPLVRSYMQKVKDLNSTAMDIDKIQGISPQEKRELITELKIAQTELARDVFRIRKIARDAQRGSSV